MPATLPLCANSLGVNAKSNTTQGSAKPKKSPPPPPFSPCPSGDLFGRTKMLVVDHSMNQGTGYLTPRTTNNVDVCFL